jgi:hypothetical protein
MPKIVSAKMTYPWRYSGMKSICVNQDQVLAVFPSESQSIYDLIRYCWIARSAGTGIPRPDPKSHQFNVNDEPHVPILQMDWSRGNRGILRRSIWAWLFLPRQTTGPTIRRISSRGSKQGAIRSVERDIQIPLVQNSSRQTAD